jgi:hypothetical protein
MKSFQNSYSASVMNSVSEQQGPKKTKREEPAQSSKLDALEQELRSEGKSSQTKTDSQLAGNAEAPTPDQRQKLMQYAPRDAGFRYYGNKLGDYSGLLSQQREDAAKFAQPMLASTLESQKESHKLASANTQLNYLSSQFGLNTRSTRVWKKAKKYPKMNNQDHFL